MTRIWAASCAELIVGEATTPNVSLSAHAHRATWPVTLALALTQAALPPMLPGLVLRAPLNWVLKLEMKPLGDTPDRWPPMNSITCGLLPDAGALFSYTAYTTWLAWPALR